MRIIANLKKRFKQFKNRKMENKMYIVEYYGGSYDDHYTKKVFVTDNKKTATKYVTKFNKMLKKWKEYYSKYEEDYLGMKHIPDKYIHYYDRWEDLDNITKCYWHEIEFRK